MKAKQYSCGFVLVEIVVALGVAAFALMAILGLCSVAVTSSKASVNDTALAEIADQIVSELRSESFYKEKGSSGEKIVYLLRGRSEVAAIPSDRGPVEIVLPERYYTSAGVRLTKDNSFSDVTEEDAEFRQAACRCRISLKEDRDSRGVPRNNLQEINLFQLRLEFACPAGSKAPPKIIYATIVRN